MPLPYSFLLSLLLLLLQEQFDPRLPVPVSLTVLLYSLPLMLIPWLLARQRAVNQVGLNRFRLSRFRLLAMPMVYAVLLLPGDLQAVAYSYSHGWRSLELFWVLLPLLLMEFGVYLDGRQLLRSADGLDRWFAGGVNPFRLPFILFLLIPLFVFSVAVDLASCNRGLLVFLTSTSFGGLLGMLAFLVFLALFLPTLFRWLMPVSSQVPELFRAASQALGFSASRVLLLHTGQRILNAALVGPFSWSRYLVLSDGIVSYLDVTSMRGVIAHEIGHAKLNHPLLLLSAFVLVPTFLIYPAQLLEVMEVNSTVLWCCYLALVLAAIYLLRKTAHRFEYEADQFSAEALGSAEACTQALQKMGQIPPVEHSRGSFRHPSEGSRIQHLLACERDPGYREAFTKKGTTIRRCILLALLMSCGLSLWSNMLLWRTDRTIMSFLKGDFQQAQVQLEAHPEPLGKEQEKIMQELAEEIAVALHFYPEGEAWYDIREDLGKKCMQHGRSILQQNGVLAARPWFAVGMIMELPTPVDESLFLYCQAVADSDEEQITRLRQHLQHTLAIPEDLMAAISSSD